MHLSTMSGPVTSGTVPSLAAAEDTFEGWPRPEEAGKIATVSRAPAKITAAAAQETTNRTTANLIPAAMLSASGFLLFGLELRLTGYGLLAASLVLAFALNRPLFRDLALIAIGVAVISAVPITTDISTSHMLIMGTAMIAAVVIPYAISRYGYRDHAVRFPVNTGQRWTRLEWAYLAAWG
jgi:L-ascorbate metabolism protein UlaG (beta-lactamase superfamily)